MPLSRILPPRRRSMKSSTPTTSGWPSGTNAFTSRPSRTLEPCRPDHTPRDKNRWNRLNPLSEAPSTARSAEHTVRRFRHSTAPVASATAFSHVGCVNIAANGASQISIARTFPDCAIFATTCFPYDKHTGNFVPAYTISRSTHRQPFMQMLPSGTGNRQSPAKLQALLAAAEPSGEDVALVAELHGLPSAGLAPMQDLTPQRRKEKTLEALLRQVEGLARQRPVLMVFDDLHWIDPSSRELLDRLIERVTDWPVLLLALFRPEFQPSWIGQPQVTMLNLTRLDRQDTAAMVTSVAGNAALPPEIVAEIAERTDGIPLFVEELTKAVLEAGA